MIQTPPSSTFEAVTDAFPSSSTVAVRIRDNQGNDFLARTTIGVTTDVTVGTSTLRRKTLTAPTTTGQWTIVWDDGTTITSEELVVTYSAPGTLSGQLYITRDELKTALTLNNTDYADDDIDKAINAASRAIDRATKRRFYTSDDTRYYTPERNASSIEIDDLTTLTSLQVDLAGTGTLTTWTDGTHFYLDPANAVADGRPYERVRLRPQRQSYWPCYHRAVVVDGTFGWAEVPVEVRQYAGILAGKLLYRARQAPFGIITISGDIGAIARIARTDPDFDTLIGHLVRSRPFA